MNGFYDPSWEWTQASYEADVEDDDYDQMRSRKRYTSGCSDRTCGATDCYNCYGGNATDGLEDEEDEYEW